MLTAKSLKKSEDALERELGEVKDAHLEFSRAQEPLCNAYFSQFILEKSRESEELKQPLFILYFTFSCLIRLWI